MKLYRANTSLITLNNDTGNVEEGEIIVFLETTNSDVDGSYAAIHSIYYSFDKMKKVKMFSGDDESFLTKL